MWPSALALWSMSEVADCPENNSIRASGQARRILIAVCTPSRSGMITSLITISGQISLSQLYRFCSAERTYRIESCPCKNVSQAVCNQLFVIYH